MEREGKASMCKHRTSLFDPLRPNATYETIQRNTIRIVPFLRLHEVWEVLQNRECKQAQIPSQFPAHKAQHAKVILP